MREWMRILFQRDGFDVLVAEDGVAARDLVGREYVDVVLTDIRMPRMDGLELLKAIRDIAPDAVVIMMTAHFTRDSDGVEAGARSRAPPRCSRNRSATSTWSRCRSGS